MLSESKTYDESVVKSSIEEKLKVSAKEIEVNHLEDKNKYENRC